MDTLTQYTRGFTAIIFIHSLLDDAGLSPAQFRVYAHLSRRASGGMAYPAIRSIADHCDLNKDTVTKSLAVLEARQMIRRVKRGGHSTAYELTSPEMWLSEKTGQPMEQKALPLSEKTGQPERPLSESEGQPENGCPKIVPPLSENSLALSENKAPKVIQEGYPKKNKRHTSPSYLPEPSPDLSEKKRAALVDWLEHKSARSETYTPRGWELVQSKVRRFTDEQVVSAIETAIELNWQGFHPKAGGKFAPSAPADRRDLGATSGIPEKKEAPENWRALARQHYPDAIVPARFSELPAEVQRELRALSTPEMLLAV